MPSPTSSPHPANTNRLGVPTWSTSGRCTMKSSFYLCMSIAWHQEHYPFWVHRVARAASAGHVALTGAPAGNYYNPRLRTRAASHWGLRHIITGDESDDSSELEVLPQLIVSTVTCPHRCPLKADEDAMAGAMAGGQMQQPWTQAVRMRATQIVTSPTVTMHGARLVARTSVMPRNVFALAPHDIFLRRRQHLLCTWSGPVF